MPSPRIDHLVSPNFTGAEYRQRRQHVAEAIGREAVALLQGAPREPTPHPGFAQSKVFYYLSGIRIERCYLLIDGNGGETTLFVPAEGISNVDGGALNEQATAALAALACLDRILPLDALAGALAAVTRLFALHRPDELPFSTKTGLMGSARLRSEDPFECHRRRDQMLLENLGARFPRMEFADLDPIIAEMRLIKSPAEIAVLRRTGRMSAQACIEGMRQTRPGMPTRALHAIADYVFRLTGNSSHAYDFIVTPSHEDTEQLVEGDLVLVDCAPDYDGYTMDIGRIWPVNGVFDAWQRHTYGIISDYHQVLLRLIAPGRIAADLYEEAATEMLEKVRGDAAGTAIVENMIARGVRYYNHHVGLSAHDAVPRWQDRPLAPGMVLVVDPMVWLDDVPHRYVRVEDTIVVTANGHERLTAAAPFEIEAIETLMQQPGRFPLSL